MGDTKLPVGVSVIITDSEGRILVSERKTGLAAGLLSTPGGRVEFKENMLECAIRETKEETGLDIATPLTVIGWKEHFRFDMHYFMFYIHAKYYSGEPRTTEPDKHGSWLWVSPDCLNSENTTEPADILKSIPVPGMDFVCSPASSVIPGLEQYEVVVAKDQPEYKKVHTLQSRRQSGEIMTRWVLTPEQRAYINQGADIILEQMTFHNGLPPVRLTLLNVASMPFGIQDFLISNYDLKTPLRPCTHCGVELVGLTKEQLENHIDTGKGALCKTKVQ